MLLTANRKHSLKMRESAESQKKERKKVSPKKGEQALTVSGNWSLHSKERGR